MNKNGQARADRIGAWLSDGGIVLAANDRAARSEAAAYHRARHAEGRRAWLTPAIFAWDAWLREQWLERNAEGLMLMSGLQEQALWARVIRESRSGDALLHVHRLAAAAQQAHRLLCEFAPDALVTARRSGWQGDAEVFSGWLREFDQLCRREGAISAGRLTLDLADKLKHEASGQARPPVMLIGFDRLLETQRMLLDAWGGWSLEEADEVAQTAKFLEADDPSSELELCVRWLREKLAADPDARLMVVAAGLEERRGALERALLADSRDGKAALAFEFSLGVPLASVGLVRAALLLLRWLSEPLSEAEVDWLIGCGHAANREEELALAAEMLRLRERGEERPLWDLEDFLHNVAANPKLTAWPARLSDALARLRAASTNQSPLEWARLAADLLEATGWPGAAAVSSAAYQARRRWERVLDECGSLGFDGSRMGWTEFVAALSAAAASAIFALESADAPVQISGPLESAGQMADGIWFLGADEERWPGRGQPHPLLPIALQRESGMPHASPAADWEIAQLVTQRLLASAGEVVFSYARHAAEWEARPSRLVKEMLGAPARTDARAEELREPLTECYEDTSRIPFLPTELRGGARALTAQSLCPFQAFATARLGAAKWDAAAAGLSARQRGLLLHEVLHRVWGVQAKGGVASLEELQAVPDLREFVGPVVRAVMRESFASGTKGRFGTRRFPARYLELEAERLVRLVSEWLEYERNRLPFSVVETEIRKDITVAGIAMHVQLDRVDVLSDESTLIVDYKSGDVSPTLWSGTRPDDVQLPLYATFAVQEELGGLVFAKLKPGDCKFEGRARDARATLLAGLSGNSGLVKASLDDEQLQQWRDLIEKLGEDFVAGRAEVDPKVPGKTCERCHLHAVCRVNENLSLSAILSGEDDAGEDASSDTSGDAAGGADA